MESLRKQAAKLLGERKKYRRWLGVFLCLAVLVTAGTVAALTMNGQALNHKEQVLECGLEVHVHRAECYESGVIPRDGTEAEEPVCGYADYVVHVHNDDCLNEDGELVCALPEIRAHVHDESCYAEERVLVCGLEETPGHVHGEECRQLVCGLEETEGRPAAEGHVHSEECRILICGQEEEAAHTHGEECISQVQGDLICENTEEGHEHSEECYAWTEELICGLEETEGHIHTDECCDPAGCGLAEGEGAEEAVEGHVHTEECYAMDACGLEEGAEGHIHTEECYEIRKTLICRQPELHTHVTKEEAAAETESCYDEEGRLICGLMELKEHVHGEECFQTVELTKEEIEAKAAEEAAKSEETEDAEADSAKTEHTLSQKIYQDALVKVTAEYDETAKIPAEAEMYVEIVSEGEAAPETEAGDQAGSDAEEGNIEGSGEENGEKDTAEEDNTEATPDNEEEPVKVTGEIVEGSSQEEGDNETETGGDSGEAEAEAPADTEGQNPEEEDIPMGGRIEIVPEEVVYRIVFRMGGEEILPEGTVTVNVWNLEEGSEPQVIVYSPEESWEQMTFTLTRMTEVFVQTEFRKIYEDGSIRVIAEYEKSAGIPEEAGLKVYEITPESDPERFADCEARFREAVENEEAEMTTLLDIGFYVGDTEIEPRDTVTMKVQFLDGEGQSIGEDVSIVHFSEDRTEVLEEKENAEGYVTFTTESFSPFAFFRMAGATVGIGRAAETEEIPLYVLKDGTWVPLEAEVASGSFTGVKHTDAYIKYESGKCKVNLIGSMQMMPTIYLALTQFDAGYNPDAWAENAENAGNYRRIGIRYQNAAGKEYITTAMIGQQDWTFEVNGVGQNVAIWTSDSANIPAGSVTGIYYLKESGEAFDKPLEDFLNEAAAQSFSSVIFNPGNGNAEFGPVQYGEKNAPRTELRIGRSNGGNTESQEGSENNAFIYLPGNSELGTSFVLFSTGENGKNADLQVKVKVDGEFTDINENRTVTVSRIAPKEGYAYEKGHKLAGWYDVITGQYYDVSKGGYEIEIDLNQDHIFYADWVAETYDFYDGNSESLIATENTNDFITTRVYDYNELFNIYSADYSSALETWTDSGSFKPLSGMPSFLFWEGGENGKKYLLNSVNNNGDANGTVQTIYPLKWTKSYENPDTSLFGYLFPQDDSAYQGVHYLGTGNYLFKHVTDGNDKIGHYVYDSSVNSASYQQSENRFYVYKGSQQSPNGIGDRTGFFPLNSAGSLLNAPDINGEINYFFGMSCEINFFLPAQTGTPGGNQIDNKNMTFSFSGDDDLWVFVEPTEGEDKGKKQLVLDLSGIHGRTAGMIDFAEGKVYINCVTVTEYDKETGESSTIVDKNNCGSVETIDFSKGSYKMTVYYLERGAGGSNCMIDFNIVPRYKIETAIADALEVTKEWSVPENQQVRIPESVTFVLERKADWEKWNRDTTGEKAEELRKKLNLEEEAFQTFKEKVEAELRDCTDFVPADTVTLQTNGKESVKYIWEGLSPYFEYRVSEEKKPGYLTTVSTETSGYDYHFWTETNELGNGEIIILNPDATKALEYKDGKLTERPVSVENGVIVTPSVESNHVVVGQEMPKQIIWKAEKRENGYVLKNSAAPEGEGYLYFTGPEGAPQLEAGATQGVFELNTEQGNGLCNNQFRVVYQEGSGFGAAANGLNDDTNSATDMLRVRIYTMKKLDSSQLYRYKVTNTYVPNIVIQKIDSETDKVIEREEGKNGVFTLTREITDGEGNKTCSYYDGTQWQDTQKDAQQTAAEKGAFELKGGTLEFKELPDGRYVLTEITPPDGYTLPENTDGLQVEFYLRNAQIQLPENASLPETRSGKAFAEAQGLTLLVRNELPPVYTVGMKFLKFSSPTVSGDSQPLEGAEFRLYRPLNGEESKLTDEEKAKLPGYTTDITEEPVIDISEETGMRPSDPKTGIFFEKELPYGTYYLKETRAPEGYYLLSDVLIITIGGNGTTKFVNINLPEDKAGKKLCGTGEDSYWEITIYNTQGYELPETGSLGTKPFTIGGAVMLISAAAILMYGYSVRRKKSERRSD